MTNTSNRFEPLNTESESDDEQKYSWRMPDKNTGDTYIVRKHNNYLDGSNKYHSFQDQKRKNVRNKNLKKILCKNIITSGSCGYDSKCLYAHKLEEQNMDDERKQAYDVLMDTNDLSGIDLQKNHSLYRSLLSLTSLCEQCNKNQCTGGYNCKFGACMKKYHICQRDLNHGDCNSNCGKIHLTSRNLKSFYPSSIRQYSAPIQGTLLSSEFFRKLGGTNTENDDLDDFSDVSDGSSDLDSTDGCNQSIFT